MTPSHPPGREKAIFEQALDLPSAEARLGYIKGACGADSALLARVETLLRAHEAPGGFLPDHPGMAANPTVHQAMPESAEKPGTVIGRYKLLEKIGEGGFGSVYMAEQEVPVRRRVALKVIKLGMDTKEVVARFEAERQALAMMDHPNIAKVLDGGATDTGRPYFVMELVKGMPITAYCDQMKLSTPARLELFILVCQAVQHAHQKGIIHRDLKPSNILVTEQDDRPLPKVIDFGVARATQARLTEKTMFTQFHQMVGTPAYMSPEQTGLANLDIDTRSDIYSLGVLLYELLTGCTPFDSNKLLEAGYEGIMRMIREVEPPKPSTRLSSLSVQELTALGGRRQEEPRRLGRLVQGDLDLIVMKALEKDRSRRYETASNLAEDLQRHLSNEPVTARSPSAVYRLRKLVARNKLAVSAAAVVTVALTVGISVSTWQAVRATQAEREAKKQAATSDKVAHFAASILGGAGPEVLRGRDTTLLKELLDQAAERLATKLADEPAAQAWLFGALMSEYLDLSEYPSAEAMGRTRLTILRKLHGDDHADVVDALGGLALTKIERGDLAESEQLAREALAITRRPGGPARKMEGEILSILAKVMRGKRNWDEAAVIGREALTVQRRLLGNDHIDLAAMLVSGEANIDNLAESEAMQREALAIRRKHLGPDDPLLADSLVAVARSTLEHGADGEAEAMLREALAIHRRQPESTTKYALLNRTIGPLSQVMASRGDLTGAESLCRETLALVEKNCGPKKDAIGIAHMNLAAVLKMRGNLAAAEAEQRTELALWAGLYGRKSIQFASALVRLARVLQERGDLAQAEELTRQALAVERERDGTSVIGCLRTLANLQAARGNAAEATSSRREAVKISFKNLPITGNALPVCLAELAGSLTAQAEFPEAEELLGEALAAEKALKYFRKDVQRRLHKNYVDLYTAWAKTDQAKISLAAEWQQKLDALLAPAIGK